LAEIHFQRGDKNNAVELIKKCVVLEPDTRYFARQLRRIGSGNPKAPLPMSMTTRAKAEEAFLLAKDIASNGPIIKGKSYFKGSGSWNVLTEKEVP
jgi:hypothetical protein